MTERPSAPKALFFDAGNTLVFLDHFAVAEAAREVGVDVPGERLQAVEPVAKRRYEAAMKTAMSHDDGWHLHMVVLFEAAGVLSADAERAARACRRAHDSFNLWRRVPGDLVPALERARAAGLQLAIVSNSEGMLAQLLERVGILHFFSHVLDSGIEGVRKPEREIFVRALSRCGVQAHQALYAGDIPNVDIDGARAAGMDAVLIDPFDHYPDYRDAPRYASVAEFVTALGL
jgi:HAD superfamily hydrolase (TIGR01509 family)